MINLLPVLENDFLILRPLHSEDFDNLYVAASDPDIWKQHPDKLRYQHDNFKVFFDNGIQSKGCLVVIDKINQQIIGSSRFYNPDIPLSEITIGYTFLTRQYWGGRFNSMIKKMMIDHALEQFNKVLFEVDEDNLRSQKALEKIGAKILRSRDYLSIDGSTKKKFTFFITKESYQL